MGMARHGTAWHGMAVPARTASEQEREKGEGKGKKDHTEPVRLMRLANLVMELYDV